MNKSAFRSSRPIGLVGLGFMGRGIAACLVASGLTVVAYDRDPRKAGASAPHIDRALRELARREIIPGRRHQNWRRRFRVARAIAELGACSLVIETIPEDLPAKRALYQELEAALPAGTVIASNTSAFPITLLQQGRLHPERFVGMHWGEPAHIMRYLELTPGKHSSARALAQAKRLGQRCGKEPAVLREDIRGFISNRMMYAMMREACHLVESGVADVETVDRSYRNDMGWWSLLAGPFRWMDLTGIPAYAEVMKGLFPKLCNDTTLPRMMREIVARGALGTANARGFYPYTQASAKRWQRNWTEFTFEMRKVADKYAKRGCR